MKLSTGHQSGGAGSRTLGRCLVLSTASALWVTSWPFPEYVKHAWPGAWVCSAFRNEGADLSSHLILQAIAATRWYWPTPLEGMITFVDPRKTRRKRDPGRCFRRAGFEHVGETKEAGLVALYMPYARLVYVPGEAPRGAQLELVA